MNRCENINSIRPAGGTSLRVQGEVVPAAQAFRMRRGTAQSGTGGRDRARGPKKTVKRTKAAPPPVGGWRQNGGKREREKQGDLPGTDGVPGLGGPKSRPAGVRTSVVATKRVTTVERRDAGKWKAGGR